MLPRPDLPLTVQRRWRLISGLTAIALGVLLGVVIALRGNAALGVDAEWMEEVVEHRSPLWEVPSFVFNVLGGGLFSTVLSLALVVLFLLLRRPWTALFVGLAPLASTIVVHVIKAALGRARPDEIMLSLESGSFPSGHVANAATLMAVLVIVLWRWWVLAAGVVYVVLMALSRTYLGAHWLSDTVGGLLIGAGVAVIAWAPFAARILSERRATR